MRSPAAFWVGVGAAAAASALLRLRFVFTPLSVDEGGYLAVARAWAGGGRLYTDIFVDRPQGLVVLYRLTDAVSGGRNGGVRVMGIAFGVVAVVATAMLVRRLASASAGVLAAWLVAVTSSAPVIEGFTANGELLSGAVSVVALALAVRWMTAPAASGWWMYGAGVAGGAAASIKQSGIDGVAAVALWLLVAAALGWRPRFDLIRAGALLAGGVATVAAALAVHGAALGWSDWWYAVAGYRLESRNAAEGAEVERFWRTFALARPTILPLVGLAVIGAVAALARGRRPAPPHWLLPLWAVAAVAAFAAGGLFHRHYWIILTFPLAALAALGLAAVPRPAVRAGLAALALAPTVVGAARVIELPREEVAERTTGDQRAAHDEAVGRWLAAHTSPDERIYVMCAGAALYAVAHRDPPYRYLWEYNVREARGAQEELVAMFADPSRAPDYVVQYQDVARCEPTGQVAAVLARDYRRVTTIGGIGILGRV